MSDHLNAARSLFDADEVREVLEGTFYRGVEPADSVPPPVALDASGVRRAKGPRKARPKADHYEIVCISMYVEDLARLDEKVATLKQSGHRRMTRSALIRYALDKLALESVPAPSY
jgi:hypothetical protein